MSDGDALASSRSAWTSRLRRIQRAQFVRGVAVIAGGSAIAQAIPVVLTPILTRIYSPNDIGILALYTAFISFAANALTLGYSQAVVSARDEQEASDLVVLSALAVAPVSVLGAFLLMLLTVNDWLGYGDLPMWATLAMGGSLVLTGLFFTLRYWLVRAGAYRMISTATIAQSIGRMVTQVALGVPGLGSAGLIAGEVIGRGAGLRSMWSSTRGPVGRHAWPPDAKRLRSVAAAYKKFPLLATPSALLNSLALVLPVPLVSTYFGLTAAGQYSIATRVLILPLALIGASVGDVFHSRIALYARERPERAFPFFVRVSGVLFLVGLVPMAVVAVYGEPLWAMVLGDAWSTSGQIAAALAPWALMQLAVSPVSRVVAVYQGQELKLIYDALGLLSIVGVLSYGSYHDWSLVETCTILGWSQALVYGVYFVLLTRIVRRGERRAASPAQGGHTRIT